jgi:hypothetical protein
MSLPGPAWRWNRVEPYAPGLRKHETAETALSHTPRSYHDHPCPRSESQVTYMIDIALTTDFAITAGGVR